MPPLRGWSNFAADESAPGWISCSRRFAPRAICPLDSPKARFVQGRDSPKLLPLVYNRSLPMDLTAIQSALRERNIDAWLFCDHHHRDPIAYRVLGLPQNLMVTRRWFYLIPADGEPLKLVHKIEAGHLDSLPGKKSQYSGWQELFDKLKAMLANH